VISSHRKVYKGLNEILHIFNLKNIEKTLWVLIILTAGAILSIQAYWDEASLKKSLNLTQIGESKFVFSTRFNNHYQISLGFNRVMNNGELVCTTSPTLACKEHFKNLNVSWQLSSSEEIIASGEVKNIVETSISGDRIGVTLDFFHSKSDLDLQLIILNKTASDELDKLVPMISVDISSIVVVNRAIYLFLMLLIGAFFIVIAMITSCLLRFKKVN
jgi:hypothetical protein